jgi:hypothetical protein
MPHRLADVALGAHECDRLQHLPVLRTLSCESVKGVDSVRTGEGCTARQRRF